MAGIKAPPAYYYENNEVLNEYFSTSYCKLLSWLNVFSQFSVLVYEASREGIIGTLHFSSIEELKMQYFISYDYITCDWARHSDCYIDFSVYC